MKRVIAALFLFMTPAAVAQMRIQREAVSHITVLVDLSGSWLNQREKPLDVHTLRATARTITQLAPELKPPVIIRYLEIGDGSLSQPPLCQARFSPNIFGAATSKGTFAKIDALSDFLIERCDRFILMHQAQPLTDITGAFNSVSLMNSNDMPGYHAVIALSDFIEDRGRHKPVGLSTLKGVHVLMLYRAQQQDRFNEKGLLARIAGWKRRLESAGAHVSAVDDAYLEPAELERLLLK